MSTPKVDTCFVISPFGEPFDRYFVHIIKPALEECGLYAVRGDSLYRPTTIVDDIWLGIREAKILIAELTDRNPNVFYELGLAHALSKPVILISKSIEDVPFDLRAIRVLLYDKDHPEWGRQLRLGLTKTIQEVLKNPMSSIPTTFKTAVKTETPEESETLIRLEILEATIQRVVAGISSLSAPDAASHEIDQATRKRARNTPGLKPGQIVIHNIFGKGEVLEVEKSGRYARAHVNFDSVGLKWLALHVAKLQVLLE